MAGRGIFGRLIGALGRYRERVRIGMRSAGETGVERARYAADAAEGEREEPGFAGDEPIVIPIEEFIDLHHFHPSEAIGILDAYLDAALEAGFREVRVVHGRGKGVQRARVRRFLAADRRVLRFQEAAPGRGGWGATLAWLDESQVSPPPADPPPVDGQASDRGGAGAHEGTRRGAERSRDR